MKYLIALTLLLLIPEAQAQSVGIPAISVDSGNGTDQTYSVTLEILALMTMLTLLPAILLMMTSFTRIIIVLSILRQALGTAQTPSNQIILGLSLFLTLFIMSPVFDQVYQLAVQPYMDGSLTMLDALRAATEPFKTFMLAQTREADKIGRASCRERV